jgi:twitching motility protein PilT
MELAKFLTLMDTVIDKQFFDLHITPNSSPYVRNSMWEIVQMTEFEVISNEDIKEICTMLLSRPFTERTLDISFEYRDTRFRVNLSHILRWISLTFRMIPSVIPSAEEIGLSPYLLELALSEKWIILITGPTGSGKTTTMATMIEYINAHTKKHIVTLEDPVEFVYKNKQSLIHQRELGKQFDTFADGIRSVLREDPDVIVIGEMRDLATIEAAITLAETGHLVLSTLHTNDTVQTVDRIIQSFPAGMQNQIRMQFGLCMRAIISQMLLPKKDGTGRVVAREIMLADDSVRNLIIRGETQNMYSVLEISKQKWMMLMDDAIIYLYKKWFVDKSTLEVTIRDRSRLETMLG